MSSKWANMGVGSRQATRFNEAWGKLGWENKTFVELTGVVGQNESRSVLTGLFSGEKREDVEAVKEKIGQQFNWELSRENVNEVIAAVNLALPALEANRPVHDKREQPDEVRKRNLEFQRIDEERKRKQQEKEAAFTRLYGNGEKVTVHPGQMAITARICFNNSDPMTDYFDSHASYGPTFALRILPDGPETEKKAREAVASYSLLASIEFTWHTEKYSMGHGNYLTSKGFELLPELQGFREAYRGGPVTHGHWEIEFSGYHTELPTFQGYGDTRKALSFPPGSPEYERLKAYLAELEANKTA